jgi:CheY-like chemotaxis protein
MSAGARTILVVEDDPDCLEAVASVLEYDGFRSVSARNGLEAIAYLEANPPPELILLDGMMPVMDGSRFLLEQRRRPALRSIPVALLSAERDLPQRAIELAVAGYIAKPTPSATLQRLSLSGRLVRDRVPVDLDQFFLDLHQDQITRIRGALCPTAFADPEQSGGIHC